MIGSDKARSFLYDADGRLIRKVDRNGRVIDYLYDGTDRSPTALAWSPIPMCVYFIVILMSGVPRQLLGPDPHRPFPGTNPRVAP